MIGILIDIFRCRKQKRKYIGYIQNKKEERKGMIRSVKVSSTHIYIYIYIYVCISTFVKDLKKNTTQRTFIVDREGRN